jgi:hypothetical protein
VEVKPGPDGSAFDDSLSLKLKSLHFLASVQLYAAMWEEVIGKP